MTAEKSGKEMSVFVISVHLVLRKRKRCPVPRMIAHKNRKKSGGLCFLGAQCPTDGEHGQGQKKELSCGIVAVVVAGHCLSLFIVDVFVVGPRFH